MRFRIFIKSHEARTGQAFFQKKANFWRPSAAFLYCRGATPIANERSDVCFLTRSMFVKRFEHKGPRLEARPWSMAAFYYFKAAVSDLIFHRAAKSGARRPACAKFAGAAT